MAGHRHDHDRGLRGHRSGTDAGKVIAVVVMIVGIGFLAVLTGAIAERFIHAERRR